MAPHVRVDRKGGITRIVLDRPEKANALTGAMLERLRDAVRGTEDRVLVLTGEGPVFSAGADLEAARAGLTVSPLWEDLSGALAAFPGLSIAALNGSCVGGAMGMMLACDLRLAVPAATFFYPVMKLGFLPQPSDPGRLTALVGPARARLLLMAGARIRAAEALKIGLVDRLAEDLDREIGELAADVLASPDGHAAAIKAMLDRA